MMTQDKESEIYCIINELDKNFNVKLNKKPHLPTTIAMETLQKL
jgi:hypothetical protein